MDGGEKNGSAPNGQLVEAALLDGRIENAAENQFLDQWSDENSFEGIVVPLPFSLRIFQGRDCLLRFNRQMKNRQKFDAKGAQRPCNGQYEQGYEECEKNGPAQPRLIK